MWLNLDLASRCHAWVCTQVGLHLIWFVFCSVDYKIIICFDFFSRQSPLYLRLVTVLIFMFCFPPFLTLSNQMSYAEVIVVSTHGRIARHGWQQGRRRPMVPFCLLNQGNLAGERVLICFYRLWQVG
jgi:hypothetical protein